MLMLSLQIENVLVCALVCFPQFSGFYGFCCTIIILQSMLQCVCGSPRWQPHCDSYAYKVW
jgi:hypothetical protein